MGIALSPGELCPPVRLEGCRPSRARFYEDTGNEGVQIEQRYQRAALLLWPTVRTVEVWLRGGRDWVLRQLAQADDPATIEALADGLVAPLQPSDLWAAAVDEEDLLQARTLDALAALPNRRHLCRLLRELVQDQFLGEEEVAAALAPRIARLSPDEQIVVLSPSTADEDGLPHIVVSPAVLFWLKSHLAPGVLEVLNDRLLAALVARQEAGVPLSFLEGYRTKPEALLMVLRACRRPGDDAALARLVTRRRSVFLSSVVKEMQTPAFWRTLDGFPALERALGGEPGRAGD